MTRLAETVLGATTSLCSACRRSVPANIIEVGSEVVMRKHCDAHGDQAVLLSADAEWYRETSGFLADLQAPARATRTVEQGCPFDCGTCEAHEQRVFLPVLPITSACNLDCPICYTHNRNENAYNMSEDELRSILRHLRVAAPERAVINLTGGEPTLHPNLPGLVEICRSEGIRRVTISTHGLTFLGNEPLLARLAELEARIVLSFDSLEEAANRALIGGNVLSGKLRVLELLERYGVQTSLLPVLALGHNDGEVGELVRLGLRKDFVRSVELHTVTFTGQGGDSFDRGARYTPDRVLDDLEVQTDGAVRRSDFVPAPAAHPMCFQSAYLLRLTDGRWLPFTRFMSRLDLREMLRGGFYLTPNSRTETILRDVMDRLWVGETVCEDSSLVLASLRRLIEQVFSGALTEEERTLRAEKSVKLIELHAYMDAHNFDTDRIRQCSVCIPEADGTSVPACAYITLYKDRDPRFAVRPGPSVATLGRGRFAVRLPIVAGP